MTLVIVDDDEGARSALARLLRCMGHAVRAFDSAESFEADAGRADCLIVDVRLPGLSGPELRDRLRSRGNLTPIVFITGDSHVQTRETARASGTPTVSKPFDDVTLMAAIADAVESRGGAGEYHAG